MDAVSNAVPSVDHRPTINQPAPTSPAGVIDFFEARHRLLTESPGIARHFAVKERVQEATVGRERYARLADALEEAFYWLLSAAVLAYLAFGIFGL
jgi:hypothetical protein